MSDDNLDDIFKYRNWQLVLIAIGIVLACIVLALTPLYVFSQLL